MKTFRQGEPKFSLIARWDKYARIYRVFRFVRSRNAKNGEWHYDEKFTLALCPSLFTFKREYWGLIVCVLGLRFHYQRAYGGRYA